MDVEDRVRRDDGGRPAAPTDDDAGEPPEDAPVDPRYEDLWVSADSAIEIPDLASIDLDFDDRDE